MIRKILVALAISLPMLSVYGAVKGDKVELRLVETTDVHGSFFPFDFIQAKPLPGSMARVSRYVDSLRQACPDGVILLDNGDIMQGQPVCYFSNYVDTLRQNIAARVVNYMNYDAQAFGNHDVETGHGVYDKWTSEVRCPSLGANIIDATTGKPYAVPYTIIHRQGVKVAVLGLLSPAIPNWLAPHIWSGLRFDDMVESARYWVNFLQHYEQPDVVVGIFHSGYDGGIVTDAYRENDAARVAREVPGFDVIFYGHDHKPHNSTDTVKGGSTVLVLNPANNAMRVAEATLSLEFDGDHWQLTNRKGELVDVSQRDIDLAYIAHFSAYIEEVKQWVNRPIGKIDKAINSHDCFFGNSEFNDLILDLMLRISGAEIALSAPLSPDAALPKGDITVGQMFNLYKFENQLYVMRLTGKELRGLLEMSYDRWVNTMTSKNDHLLKIRQDENGKWGFVNASYNFDAAAGINYEVDVTKPDGEKVRILSMANGEAFDENKEYRVAVNSYRGNGGGELMTRGAGIAHDQLESRIIYKSDRDLRSYLIEEIARQGTISPKKGTNWRFVPEKWTTTAAQRDRRLLGF